MSADLDEKYFVWLYGQVCPVRQKNRRRTYWKLFRILYSKEFVWTVPNDDNRVDDGRELRLEWLQFGREPLDYEWVNMGCSFLELLIGLSRRAAYITSEDPIEWFWEMVENLKLRRYNDASAVEKYEVEPTLDAVIDRTYSKNGLGGLFPLSKSRKDQRKVELWYQLHAYIEERGISY